MSFKEELMQLYIKNSDSHKAFEVLLEDLKSEMLSISEKGEDYYICIDEKHSLSPILKHKKLLIDWCDKEELYYNGVANGQSFVYISIYWI